MNTRSFISILLLVILQSSCNISPVDISYDYDQCAFCKMTISDSRFGCELVTTKGKIYKYDAIECLIPELNNNGKDYYKYILVTDFYKPKTLIDATKAKFVISTERPSPMGANLSAYEFELIIEQDENLKDKKVYSLQELLELKSQN